MEPISCFKEGSAILTIKDIADQANVAKSTVSRVLNNSGYVKEETRMKIEKVINESKYVPSATARNLSKQESNIIGLIIPELSNTFYMEIIEGISEVVEKNNLILVLCNTDNDLLKEQRALAAINGLRVKGLIFAPAADYASPAEARKIRQWLNELNVPIIMLDRWVENSQWDGVYFDNPGGAYKATEALIKAGHKKIGTITGNLNISIGRERFKGFQLAMEDYEIPISPQYVYQGDFTTAKAYELTKKMIASGDLPEALFISNNLTAIGFLKGIYEAGMELGRDICCVGFDNVAFLDIMDINYSYVDRDTKNMGFVTAKNLLEIIKNPVAERHEHIIQARLVLRGSEKFKQ